MHAKLQPHLLAYIEQHRPVLLDGKTASALWISERGNALNNDSFASGLALVTERAFGFPFRAHAFRAIAATSIAEYAPESVGIIRDILGHATLDMAEKHYNRATAKKASQRYQDLTNQLRRESTREKFQKRKS